MPRTRRYIFNTLAVMSLLMMLATVGLWVDGYSNDIGLINYSVGGTFSSHGGIWVVMMRTKSTNEWRLIRFASDRDEIEVLYSGDRFAGFVFPHYQYTMLFARIPHWFLTLIFTIWPAIWLLKWNKRRRLIALGHCPSCAYDLTGNETGKCPECGTALRHEVTKA